MDSSMRRSFVILLCIFNALIAGGLLWFVIGKPQSRTPLLVPEKEAPESNMTDAERWTQATQARNLQEALHSLNTFMDKDALRQRTSTLLEELAAGTPAEVSEWPFLQAAMIVHGREATEVPRLTPLAAIASGERHALTLRETAFRSYVENRLRISEAFDEDELIYSLIDSLYTEPNSLSETSLLAEQFLVKNGVSPEGREGSFKTRLEDTLLDTGNPESVRITALKILSAMDAAGTLPLDRVYENSDRELRTAILQALASSIQPGEAIGWLEQIRPTTPEQEQLRLRILKP